MATLEYNNHVFSIEMESGADSQVGMTSNEYRDFLRSLATFNDISEIDTLTLKKQNSSYLYGVTTKTGKQTSYVFHQDGEEFEIELTTNGTRWEPEALEQNIDVREKVFALIVEFKIFKIELEYY